MSTMLKIEQLAINRKDPELIITLLSSEDVIGGSFDDEACYTASEKFFTEAYKLNIPEVCDFMLESKCITLQILEDLIAQKDVQALKKFFNHEDIFQRISTKVAKKLLQLNDEVLSRKYAIYCEKHALV